MRSDSATAKYWEPQDHGRVRCGLCPHGCLISEGGRGICGIRKNIDGTLMATAYGIYPAVHMDPIEKKPLNHFLPGSRILSVGSVGCNLKCLHCQNWSLSCETADGMEPYLIPPELLIERSLDGDSVGIAFTYNEPTINYEYLMDVIPELDRKGAKVVLVTNGYLSPGPWDDLMEHTHGANIDVKGFTENFYKEVAGGKLAPVLRNVKSSYEKGVHVEIAYLVIPDRNDDDGQVDDFLDWVLSDLSADVPVHFNRFHPDHRMLDVPATSRETLEGIRKKAMDRGLHHVYIGNIGGKDYNSTFCPKCGAKLISRDFFSAGMKKLKGGRCGKCSAPLYGVWKD
ncbi:MAG: AmmeMemoRadiSam system radical SAM enzyme [Thermoplasmatota archaeon]